MRGWVSFNGRPACGSYIPRPPSPLPLRRRQWRQLDGLSSTYSIGSSSSMSRAFSMTSQWQQTRALHATRRQENIVVGGLVVAGGALALQYGLKVRAAARRKEKGKQMINKDDILTQNQLFLLTGLQPMAREEGCGSRSRGRDGHRRGREWRGRVGGGHELFVCQAFLRGRFRG